MVDPSRTVFLSYRREVSWPLAHAVRGDLVQHGFDVFMDVHGVDNGEFERVILREIERRTHFLLLVEPRTFDRMAEHGDWLRREVAHALAHGRNIVPLLASSTRLPVAETLPTDVARLPSFNAVSIPHDYFPEAMQKLRERFLRAPAQEPRPIPSADARDNGPRRPYGRRGAVQLAPPVLLQQPVRSTWAVSIGWTGVAQGTPGELQHSPTADFAVNWTTPVIGAPADFHIMRSDVDRGRFVRVRALAADSSPGPWSNVVELR